MKRTLSQSSKTLLVKTAEIAAGDLVVTTHVDMTEYEFDSVAFFGRVETANPGNKVSLAIGDGDDFTPLLKDVESGVPAEGVPTADGNVWMLDAYRPIGGQYVRVEVDRSGADTALGDIYAVLYNAAEVPVGGIPQDPGMDVWFWNGPEI